MNRLHATKIIDVIAFCLFALMVSSGVILHYVIPVRSGRSVTIWGMTRHEWGDIHFWIATIFLGVLVMHLFIHGRFIMNMIGGAGRNYSGIRFSLGLVALLAILLLAVSPFLWN